MKVVWLFLLSLLVVGNPVCLVLLCLISARRDKVCPLYRVRNYGDTNLSQAPQKPSGPLEDTCTISPFKPFEQKWPCSCSALILVFITLHYLCLLHFLCYLCTLITLLMYTPCVTSLHYFCYFITFLMYTPYVTYVHSLCYLITILMLLHYIPYVTFVHWLKNSKPQHPGFPRGPPPWY